MKKITLISLAAIVLIACAAGFTIWKMNDDKKKKELAVLADLAAIQAQVTSLYQDSQKSILAESTDNAKINAVNALFEGYQGKKLSDEAAALLEQASLDMDFVEKMFSLKLEVTGIFDANGAASETADLTLLKEQLDALKADKPAFVDEQMIMITDAEAQMEQIQTTTKTVEALFASPEKSAIKDALTQKEIDDAKAKVASIKQEQTKTVLLASVQSADELLQAKIKAEAEAKAKAEAEAKAKAEAEAKKAKKKSVDISEWVPYSTGDPATLLKNLLSGDVVEYNGQYYASPRLFNMLKNQEVVSITEISSE
ncbi:toxin Cry1Ac domain D-VI-related protein [Paenibacillus sp. 1011MAR3C5]|uniref:toxin Cry1Ac domain D-VI-related protein n=1 Tax=Paenibacillus sp. 1011MAR3C5 TaxID=1675787 RepID=UPI00160332F7|nr:toxin Cry1Ac domain D-VI-related protein [Paenibacillus sp. 1011MAR3C5]